MADKQDSTKKRQLKKPESIRERAAKADTSQKKPRRIKLASKTALRPFKAAVRTGRKEVFLPMPDTKAGRFLNKRRNVFPRYFGLAWKELRQVKWPSRRDTIKLTFAVFLFAIFLALYVGLNDYGLDKVFKKLILK